jgi:dihydrofolate reductase
MENKDHAMISIIVAMSPQRAIGFRNRLPWHLPEDMAHFKALTTGHTIIMGRKTFESLPNGALPHRRNVIITRHCDTMKERFQGCIVYDSLENALKYEAKNHEVFIIGGGSIYRQALPLADKIYATLIEQEPKEADAWFPEIDMSKWHITKKEKHTGFSFLLLERR